MEKLGGGREEWGGKGADLARKPGTKLTVVKSVSRQSLKKALICCSPCPIKCLPDDKLFNRVWRAVKHIGGA